MKIGYFGSLKCKTISTNGCFMAYIYLGTNKTLICYYFRILDFCLTVHHQLGNVIQMSRSHWPRGLRRRSAAARLLRLWVRIPPGAWMFVCCECCVLSGSSLCDELITRSGESYRLWRVVVCDQETSYAWRLKPARGL